MPQSFVPGGRHRGPDPGDPVTLPTQAFDIVEGQDTAFTVMFDLVFG